LNAARSVALHGLWQVAFFATCMTRVASSDVIGDGIGPGIDAGVDDSMAKIAATNIIKVELPVSN
jgi:hypothetical protein